MKIVCTSDTHGHLPEIPECDLFLHAGDICPFHNHKVKFQESWLLETFNPWLDKIPAKDKVICWGNHDFIGQEKPNIKYQIRADVITDEVIERQGLKIWGSPWTLEFFDWAFNLNKHDLYKLHRNIPQCDIILTHGPPYGFGDIALSMENKKQLDHCGSPGLIERILEIEPKLVVFGHIHNGFGIRKLGNTTIANVSYCNESYRPRNNPVIFEI